MGKSRPATIIEGERERGRVFPRPFRHGGFVPHIGGQVWGDS